MFFQLVVLIFEKLVIVVLQCTFCFKKAENMSSFRVGLHPSWSFTYYFPLRFVYFLWMIGFPYRVIFVGANRGWFTTLFTSKTGRYYASKLGKERFFIIGEMDPSECGTREGLKGGHEWMATPPPKKKRTSPRKTNMEPLKRDYFSREYIFQPLIFRGVMLVFRGVGGGFNDLFIFTLTWGNDPID